MIKKLKYPNNDTLTKLKVMNALRLINLSDTESAVLAELIEYSSSNTITLSVEMTRQMRNKLAISATSFNTFIHRLELKGTLKKEGKTIILNPLYNNLSELNQVIITFANSTELNDKKQTTYPTETA